MLVKIITKKNHFIARKMRHLLHFRVVRILLCALKF